MLKIALRADETEKTQLLRSAMNRAHDQVLSEGDEDLRDYVALDHIRKLDDAGSKSG